MYPNHKGRSPEEKTAVVLDFVQMRGGEGLPKFFVTNTRAAVFTREAFPKDKSCGLNKIKKMLS